MERKVLASTRSWGRRVASAVVSLVIASVSLALGIEGQDTLTIEAEGHPLWGDAVRLLPELRIGRIEGAPESAFGLVGPVAIGARGEILVVDVMVPAVRVFDSAGAYVRSLGARGHGPGEFGAVRGLQVTGHGVAVWDPLRQRVSVFDTLGNVRTSFRASTGLLTADALRADTAGNLLVRALGPPPPRGVERPAVWLKYSPVGDFLDTIAIPAKGWVGPNEMLATNAGPIRPFPSETISDMSPFGYQVSGRNDNLAFARALRDGRVVRVGRAHSPVTVLDDEHQQWQALLESMARRSGKPSVEPVPRVKPAFRDMWVDDDGRVWLWRYVEAERTEDKAALRTGRPAVDWREPPTWDVFDPRGVFLGSVRLPHDARPAATRGLEVLVVEVGDFGEQYVVRYRIVPEPERGPSARRRLSR